jgi:hypothetical protein
MSDLKISHSPTPDLDWLVSMVTSKLTSAYGRSPTHMKYFSMSAMDLYAENIDKV